MANRVTKADHFYGAFLTKLLDDGNAPVLIDKDSNRGVYELVTDKDEYLIYMKYATRKNKNRNRWSFNYTDNNIEEIKNYEKQNKNIILAYICGYNDLLNTEIGIADLKELKECINPECEINKSNRVTIYKKSGSPVLRMYGTARADEIDDKDNTIHLSRDRINNL